MSEKKTVNDKFKDMDYGQASKRLSELITDLESGNNTFDQTMALYKEAFEYYTFCTEYLSNAGEMIRRMNEQMSTPADITGE